MRALRKKEQRHRCLSQGIKRQIGEAGKIAEIAAVIVAVAEQGNLKKPRAIHPE